MKKKYLNSENFLKTLYVNQKAAYELARHLGAGMEANRIYERVCNVPGQTQVTKSKKGKVEAEAKIVLGIVSTLQKESGKNLIKEYVPNDEIVEFMFELDDFFNELYSQEYYAVNE